MRAARDREFAASGRPGRLASRPRGSHGVMVTFDGFDRITADRAMLGGKPCIRGMRISVQQVLDILSGNPSWDDLRQDYPKLDPEAIRQALAFASASMDVRILPLPTAR